MKFQCYFGDIHNHCNRSYAHGSLEDALLNAKLQLDFVSITGHSSWPDIPAREAPLESLVDYHENGFRKLEKGWSSFVDQCEEYNEPGRFVCFPSYEIHSLLEGDHTVYFRNHKCPMFKPKSIRDFQDIIREIRNSGDDAFLTPHHIGYRRGYRGINWDVYDESVSPFIEIVSMHGCSESDDAAHPYLHTMGPLNGSNTMQAGLERGFHFGVIGSTDHHSAHPGSHGYGKVALWAESLTKENIWQALKNRRCYALTGDRIELDFSIDGLPMGSILPFREERSIEIYIKGGDALDYVELLKNNRVIRRWDNIRESDWNGKEAMRGKIFIEAGWGKTGVCKDWNIGISLSGGEIVGVEPRLHGIDTVDPEQAQRRDYQFSQWKLDGKIVKLKTKTWGNLTTKTNSNQGISLEIYANSDSVISVKVNGMVHQSKIGELYQRSDSFYTEKFLSAAVHLHKFVPQDLYRQKLQWSESDSGGREDSYYVRVKQRNCQWAYSSPIWVKKKC